MVSGLRSRYHGHVDGLQKSVEAYKKSLPEGMEASTVHIDMLLRDPHHSTLKARTGGVFKRSGAVVNFLVQPRWHPYQLCHCTCFLSS